MKISKTKIYLYRRLQKRLKKIQVDFTSVSCVKIIDLVTKHRDNMLTPYAPIRFQNYFSPDLLHYQLTSFFLEKQRSQFYKSYLLTVSCFCLIIIFKHYCLTRMKISFYCRISAIFGFSI